MYAFQHIEAGQNRHSKEPSQSLWYPILTKKEEDAWFTVFFLQTLGIIVWSNCMFIFVKTFAGLLDRRLNGNRILCFTPLQLLFLPFLKTFVFSLIHPLFLILQSRLFLWLYLKVFPHWSNHYLIILVCQHHISVQCLSSLLQKTSQELRMLSCVTLDCQVTKTVMNSCSQLSEL